MLLCSAAHWTEVFRDRIPARLQRAEEGVGEDLPPPEKHAAVITNLILGIALIGLLAGVAVFYRYSRTDSWRHGDVRRATFELLLVIGPFFGVRVKPPEPEPPAVLTPKGDDEDPNAGQFRIGRSDAGDGDRPTD